MVSGELFHSKVHTQRMTWSTKKLKPTAANMNEARAAKRHLILLCIRELQNKNKNSDYDISYANC